MDMNGPREYHTNWSKLEKGKYYMVTYMYNLKMIQMNMYKTDMENRFMITKVERDLGKDKLGACN